MKYSLGLAAISPSCSSRFSTASTTVSWSSRSRAISLPRTLSAGVPYDVDSATSGSFIASAHSCRHVTARSSHERERERGEQQHRDERERPATQRGRRVL